MVKALVTGGARSGKSGFAERYAATLGAEGLYIATAHAYDAEMEERIVQHRLDRERQPFRWTTAEAPYELAKTLRQADAPVVLVDCLTLWLSNWLLRLEHEPNMRELLDQQVEELADAFRSARQPIVLVTNEVGNGLVPEYKLGRLFRDVSGRMNQRLAAEADQLFLVTCGVAVELKSQAYRL
ncbi:bifunctional adenosylcobinamide kinase/adenosylcobinamide-phosphate guanylyltransferase [Paenibacillus sp. YYML68]|uniref:bifunctional adenosylcobinamide kinase/adenosylcobinamide-phosphate guanylyltransferase n=1 Tax=Paenibacillus sp. YYML68 TaxID=2909250 RepID=UPI002492DAC0|nr:bifunctional adenosylcobinamide kinase/adenosylcobinamide-phosphate guanylyltransferase [Paenibacillus sp. YYML68]